LRFSMVHVVCFLYFASSACSICYHNINMETLV
jgi:hypothetical protein